MRLPSILGGRGPWDQDRACGLDKGQEDDRESIREMG